MLEALSYIQSLFDPPSPALHLQSCFSLSPQVLFKGLQAKKCVCVYMDIEERERMRERETERLVQAFWAFSYDILCIVRNTETKTLKDTPQYLKVWLSKVSSQLRFTVLTLEPNFYWLFLRQYDTILLNTLSLIQYKHIWLFFTTFVINTSWNIWV